MISEVTQMKRLILAALVLAVAPATLAQLYKYTDKDGKTVYSDTPPANVDSKQIRVQTAPPTPTDAPPKAAAAAAKDKDPDKGRKEKSDAGKKAEDEARRKADNAERCANARENLRVAESGRRQTRLSSKGELEYLEDHEIEANKAARRADVERACKES